ncbi:MAG: hypothetical protein K5657_08955 [Desulfovibrio sp.]|nr:hypothetical protein [Desulfovibrio sp.]
MRKTAVLLLLLGALLLEACARHSLPDEEPLILPDNCHEAWIYAPGHYVLDLAEGKTVHLNPFIQDFPLYCLADKARDALSQAIEKGQLSDGDWALYRLDGTMKENARMDGEQLILVRKARLTTWESFKMQGKTPIRSQRNEKRAKDL